MECLDPPLQEVPVDEWFCPECVVPEAAASTAGRALSEHSSEQTGQGTPGWELGGRAALPSQACR